MKTVLFAFLFNAFWANVCGQGETIDLKVLPEEVITYQEKGNWILNFDFWFSSNEPQEYTLRYVDLKVFSRSGLLISRKHLSHNGIPGSLSTLSTKLKPYDDLYIFNPFATLPGEIYPHRLEFSFYFDALKIEKTVLPKLLASQTYLELPVVGKSFIDDGNDYYSHHRRVSLNSDAAKALNMKKLAQRFALDFTVVDSLGNKSKPGAASNRDWYGWQMKVVSPGSGTVIRVRNNVADNRYESGHLKYSDEVQNKVSEDISTGNYIIIDHSNGEYSLLCHFQKGTIRFKEGDKIAIGDYIGDVGLSGDTFYPHLHYQLQSSPDIIDSYGIPPRLNNFIWVSQKDIPVRAGFINSGDMVKPDRE